MMENMQPQHYSPRPPQDHPPKRKRSDLDVAAIAFGVAGGVAIFLGWLASTAHESSSGPFAVIGAILIAVCIVFAVLARDRPGKRG